MESNVNNYSVDFGHEEDSKCKRTTRRILRGTSEEELRNVNIREMGDPELDSCSYCDMPLTRVKGVTRIGRERNKD